jgi:hypothetical protein
MWGHAVSSEVWGNKRTGRLGSTYNPESSAIRVNQSARGGTMIPKLSRLAAVLALGLFALTIVVGAQSKDPFVGTWRMNVAKSKYSPGPTPKSVTSTYEAAGKGYKVSVRNEPASGPVQQYSYTTTADGTDAKVTGNNPNADTIAVKRVNANTLEIVNKKNGKATTTQRNVVSADGKTRTVTTTGVDAQGQKVNNVAVFEKQ